MVPIDRESDDLLSYDCHCDGRYPSIDGLHGLDFYGTDLCCWRERNGVDGVSVHHQSHWNTTEIVIYSETLICCEIVNLIVSARDTVILEYGAYFVVRGTTGNPLRHHFVFVLDHDDDASDWVVLVWPSEAKGIDSMNHECFEIDFVIDFVIKKVFQRVDVEVFHRVPDDQEFEDQDRYLR